MLPKFDVSDLDRTVPDEAKLAIADVILAFARLDTGLSAWLVNAYGVRPRSNGALLVENMDLSNKIQRLRRLYDHAGHTDEVEILKDLKSEFDRWKDTRNTIAHANCAGVRKSDPDFVVFSPMKAVPKSYGHMEVVLIATQHMRRAAAWASHRSSFIDEVLSTFDDRPEEASSAGDRSDGGQV